MTAADTTLDLLLDLKHDLGKHLYLPLSLLPKSAGDEALREALNRALNSTRKQGERSRSARELWAEFEAELARDPNVAGRKALGRVRDAVLRALAWEAALDGRRALDRAALEADFAAVQAAIAELVAEVRDG